MNIQIDNKLFGVIVTAVSVVFGAYMYLDNLHIDENELELDQMEQDAVVEALEDDITTRMLMSQSTRYAEIAKYYGDVQRERSLTKAEELRLKNVEDEQCRIRNIISKHNVESCD